MYGILDEYNAYYAMDYGDDEDNYILWTLSQVKALFKLSLCGLQLKRLRAGGYKIVDDNGAVVVSGNKERILKYVNEEAYFSESDIDEAFSYLYIHNKRYEKEHIARFGPDFKNIANVMGYYLTITYG